MRTKQIDIGGKAYWISFSEGVKIDMRDRYGVDCDDSKAFTAAMKEARTRLGLVYSCMVYGVRWAKLTGHDATEPPALEDFAALVDTADILAVMGDIMEVVAGERGVVAKPTKK